MANTIAGTVYRIDTTGLIANAINIAGLKFVGGTTGVVTIRAGSAAGQIVYENTASTTLPFEEVYMRNTEGFHVTISGTGTVLYLYTK